MTVICPKCKNTFTTRWISIVWTPRVVTDSEQELVNSISDEHTDPHHEEKTIAEIFEESYMKLGKRKFMGEEQTMFKCKKCGENIEEFLLYAHLQDHKNPESMFGKEAWDSIPDGVEKESLRYRFDQWEAEE